MVCKRGLSGLWPHVFHGGVFIWHRCKFNFRRERLNKIFLYYCLSNHFYIFQFLNLSVCAFKNFFCFFINWWCNFEFECFWNIQLLRSILLFRISLLSTWPYYNIWFVENKRNVGSTRTYLEIYRSFVIRILIPLFLVRPSCSNHLFHLNFNLIIYLRS